MLLSITFYSFDVISHNLFVSYKTLLLNCDVNFALFADGTIGLDALVQLVSDKITDPEPQSADQLSELFRMFDRVSMILNMLY